MALRCGDCRWFDDKSTGLPICTRHRRYTHRDWTCADRRERGDGWRREASRG